MYSMTTYRAILHFGAFRTQKIFLIFSRTDRQDFLKLESLMKIYHSELEILSTLVGTNVTESQLDNINPGTFQQRQKYTCLGRCAKHSGPTLTLQPGSWLNTSKFRQIPLYPAILVSFQTQGFVLFSYLYFRQTPLYHAILVSFQTQGFVLISYSGKQE